MPIYTMRSSRLLLALLPACGFSAGDHAVDAGTKDSTIPDAFVQTTFGSLVQVTFTSAADVPTAPMALDGLDIDTDKSDMCNANTKPTTLCVVSGTTVSLSSSTAVTAHGSRPLVILATQAFNLDGTIDVSSSITGPKIGAGAQTSCIGNTPASVSSGGFGGSFADQGGDGADDATGTGGTSAGKTTFPGKLIGGCPGGDGAKKNSSGGVGGAGGGAVDLISPVINISGKINASGAAGAGGPGDPNNDDSGGGGGGSGGMIVFDTPSLLVKSGANSSNVWLYAGGGGGGQGGVHGNGGANTGEDGKEAADPFSTVDGGANLLRSGGHGGTGANGTVHTQGGDGQQGNGGGGGGGGVGFVYAQTIAGAQISGVSVTPH